MRASIIIAGAAVLIGAAGAGYYGLAVYPQQQFRTGLDQTLRNLPSGMAVLYKDAHYSVFSRKATITGVTLHGDLSGDTTLPFDVTIDSIETSNPNLDFASAWSKAAANPASFAPETAIRIADSVVVQGVTIHSAVINVTEQTTKIDNPRVYPWALLHEGLPSWNEVRVSLTPAASPPDLAALRPLLRLEAAVILGIGYDGYRSGGAKVTETLPGINISYEVQQMTASGFDRGVLNGGAAEGIKGDGDKIGAFSVDRLSIGASDFRAPMVRLVNGEALSLGLLDGIKVGRIEYSGITAQPPGQALMHLGTVSAGPFAFAQGLPVSGEMAWNGLSLARSQMPDAKSRDMFEKLDVETMTISFNMVYNWDAVQQHVSVRDTTLKVNELGTIALAAELTNLGPEIASLNQASLAHARLRFDDASLVDRLLRIGAAQTGVDLPAYRAQIEAMVRQISSDPNMASPMLTAAGQAISDFIEQPHTLTIELAPPAPVPLMEIQRAAESPATLVTRLGFKVSANQP
jgi:hypothetical protein